MKNNNLPILAHGKTHLKIFIEEKIIAYLFTSSNRMLNNLFRKIGCVDELKFVGNYQLKLEKKIIKLFDTIIDDVIVKSNAKQVNLSNQKSIEQIYLSLANKQVGISVALGLIPPPFSYLSFVPELCIIIRSQLQMITEMGIRMGKVKDVNKELILGIYLSTINKNSNQALIVKESNVFISQLNRAILEKISKYIAQEILKQFAESMVARLIPGLGPTFLSIWTRYSTINLGKFAENIYTKNIMTSQDSSLLESIITSCDSVNRPVDSTCITIETIRLFINLMNIDLNEHVKEYDNILDLIKNAQLSTINKKKLLKELVKGEKLIIDYDLINQVESKYVLLIDLVAFANLDGTLRQVEKDFIAEVANKLNVIFEV